MSTAFVHGGLVAAFGRRATHRRWQTCYMSMEGGQRSSDSSRPAWRGVRARSGAPVTSIREIVQSKEVAEADALILGETHDDPVAHKLEVELLRELLNIKEKKPMLSMEILERDVQLVVDEYVQDVIREADFKSNARLPFNYDSDYKALIEMAKEHNIKVVAPNAPRRYVSLARRVGRENLEGSVLDAAKNFLPPLPYAPASTRYANKFARIMAALRGEDVGPGAQITPPSPGMLDAQSLWDASMAHAICSAADGETSSSSPRPIIFHIGGGFHVEHGLGICEHIPRYNKELRTATITIRPGNVDDPVDKDKDIADFLIITNEDLPRSYQ
mmetsp:Transcript_7383/g.22489  ORF Transcript_7383/g.22489 Transcript_7383/m.22489 type:complete len:330 (+) Transcript_7383:114-1103(+)